MGAGMGSGMVTTFTTVTEETEVTTIVVVEEEEDSTIEEEITTTPTIGKFISMENYDQNVLVFDGLR